MARLNHLTIVLITLLGLTQCARQKSPLLIEDDGNRRNRPAGELNVLETIFHSISLVRLASCAAFILFFLFLSTSKRAK
jgi:hypothetical protein